MKIGYKGVSNMFCNQCGKSLQDDSRKCKYCGNKSLIENGWYADPEMQELLQELHISFSELPEQKIMLQPALEEPKEQTTSEAPILEDALPTQSTTTTPPPERTATAPWKNKKIVAAIAIVLVAGIGISSGILYKELKKNIKPVEQAIESETTVETTTVTTNTELSENDEPISKAQIQTTKTYIKPPNKTAPIVSTTVVISTTKFTTTTEVSETISRSVQPEIKGFGWKEVQKDSGLESDDLEQIEKDVSDPKMRNIQEYMENKIETGYFESEPIDSVDFSNFNYEEEHAEEDDSDEYDATEIVITWNGADYSLKYQKNSSTFGQQYQLFQENQTNPVGFLYARKSYDENGYENEYILLYLEDRSYFYIGKLDWKHDFYALYL